MKKIGMLFLLVFLSSAMADDTCFLEPESAVKKIGNKNTQFIFLGNDENIIMGSKKLDVRVLSGIDVIGNMNCKPFYICPKKVKKYFDHMGIKENQELILYDNQYGVNAATLYSTLEIIGYKNIKILNGGILSIKKIDPNQKVYTKYLNEKNLLSNESNSSNREETQSKISKLSNKLAVLKPLLLIQPYKESILSDDNISTPTTLKILNEKFDYLVSREKLESIANHLKYKQNESNSSLLDACSMIDIVGNRYGSYKQGVHSVDWKELIDGQKRSLQDKDPLEIKFKNAGLKQEEDIYVYCMSGPSKAFYMSLALRRAGYSHVKVFSGDWDVWRGDSDE